MKVCPKCDKPNFDSAKICDYCAYFFYHDMLKEIIFISKKYFEQENYSSMKQLLNKTLNFVKNTKYEEKILKELKLVNQKLEEQKSEFFKIKDEAEKYKLQKKYKHALKYFRKLLNFPLDKTQRVKIENELIRIRASIYNYEMQNLFEDDNPSFRF
jgi:hypothetical protein